jgi:ATP-dependent Clp protease, protease subunit
VGWRAGIAKPPAYLCDLGEFRLMGAGYRTNARATEFDAYVYEDVGEFFGGVTAREFAADLSAAGSVSVINLHISSLGGDVNEGLAIHRTLLNHPARVLAFVDGWAASIASVIAMAGDEIRISESGAIMIHEAWGITAGGADIHEARAQEMRAQTGAIASAYVKRTGNSTEDVLAWMAEEKWFYGQEAVDAGFADGVMENLRVAAHFDPARHKFKHPPATLAEAAPIHRPRYEAAAGRVAFLKAKLAMRQKELRAA